MQATKRRRIVLIGEEEEEEKKEENNYIINYYISHWAKARGGYTGWYNIIIRYMRYGNKKYIQVQREKVSG